MKKFLKSAICILLAVITVSMCACNTVEDEESTQPVTEATEQPTEATPPARIVSAFVLKNKKTKNAYITAEDIEAVEVAEDQLPEDYITKKTQVIGKWAAEDLPADT
ncbi:MAG: SAF domain-containing protein, partial [Clostridia bacterium]|nr:SAF domain-containing protein [Clostridia bacterium]